MYRQIIYIGFGIYGIILSIGFMSLAVLRGNRKADKNDVRGQIYERIMQSINTSRQALEAGNGFNAMSVRDLDDKSIEKTLNRKKAFPFLEVRVNEKTGEDDHTELLNSDRDKLEELNSINDTEKTDILETESRQEITTEESEHTELLNNRDEDKKVTEESESTEILDNQHQ